MAEILGVVASGMTVAGLIKVALDAFDLIQVARQQGVDYEKLVLRLNIERARLYTWGQAMGFTNSPDAAVAHASATNLLCGSPHEALVKDTLQMIVRLFYECGKLHGKYGCAVADEAPDEAPALASTTQSPIPHELQHAPLPSPSPPQPPQQHLLNDATTATTSNAVDALAASFAHFRLIDDRTASPSLRRIARLRSRARWVIRDRQKFAALVQEIRGFVDRLQEITRAQAPAARQAGLLRYNVQQIRSADTLGLIAEVCEADYPDLSDAASVKLDVLSLPTERRRAIADWAAAVPADGGQEEGVEEDALAADLERLTITDLKRLVRALQAPAAAQRMLDRLYPPPRPPLAVATAGLPDDGIFTPLVEGQAATRVAVDHVLPETLTLHQIRWRWDPLPRPGEFLIIEDALVDPVRHALVQQSQMLRRALLEATRDRQRRQSLDCKPQKSGRAAKLGTSSPL